MLNQGLFLLEKADYGDIVSARYAYRFFVGTGRSVHTKRIQKRMDASVRLAVLASGESTLESGYTGSAMVGPYKINGVLPPSRWGRRWLAFHDEQQCPFMLYQFEGFAQRAEQRRFISAFEQLSQLEHPHLLRLMEFAFESTTDSALLVTPFPAGNDGLLTMDRLLEQKQGRMRVPEVRRAIVQLLETLSFVHSKGILHGPLGLDEILVDPRGSLTIDLYGFRRRVLGAHRERSFDVADEIRSVVELAYTLVTGLSADAPRIRMGSIHDRTDRNADSSFDAQPDASLDRWIEAGLDPASGFDSADAAMLALSKPETIPTIMPEVRTVTRAAPLLWRLRSPGRFKNEQ